MIPYGRQSINDEDIEAVSEVLKSDWLTTGPKVEEFEKEFAQYVGGKYAVAVSSGTAGLHIACLAAGLRAGDELITTPMTFAASANCALYCGAKPVFADITDDGLIDPDKVKRKITDKTRIIIPVHYSGLPCAMGVLKKIADEHNLTIIEDACHAVGASHPETGSKVGSCEFSDMSVFSFHPVKHITTGEGGMVTTNSKELYEKLLILRTHGITKDPDKLKNKPDGPWYHEMQMLGFNYRITDFQCALGLSQLRRVDGFVAKRREIARRYDEAFEDIDEVDTIGKGREKANAYHLYVIKVKDRKMRLGLFEHLKKNSIFCQVHYIPVYRHPYYESLGYKEGLCPRAEEFYEASISLPIFPALTDKEQARVVSSLKEFFRQKH